MLLTFTEDAWMDYCYWQNQDRKTLKRINKLIKDAELHAEDDKKKKELVEARNTADALIYQTEKSIKDLGDKVDSSTKSTVESAVSRLKKAMEGDDASEIRKMSEELTQSSHKLAEAMYKQASQSAGGTHESGSAGSKGRSEKSAKEEDVVDADFEEVKDK